MLTLNHSGATLRHTTLSRAIGLALGLGLSLGLSQASSAASAEYYQTKTPYQPQQALASYEAAPQGFKPVYTQLLARHGSRGLSSLKYDLAVYNMWLQAQADGALTPLGAQLGPDVLALMRANFLLGYGVEGISKPGYGNETLLGIQEHQKLAKRLTQRLGGYWQQVADAAANAPRSIVTVTSGVDRAVDSGHYFVQGLLAAKPALATLVSYPAAPPVPGYRHRRGPARWHQPLLALLPQAEQIHRFGEQQRQPALHHVHG
jgi:hypothetical protein